MLANPSMLIAGNAQQNIIIIVNEEYSLYYDYNCIYVLRDSLGSMIVHACFIESPIITVLMCMHVIHCSVDVESNCKCLCKVNCYRTWASSTMRML